MQVIFIAVCILDVKEQKEKSVCLSMFCWITQPTYFKRQIPTIIALDGFAGE
ncbi:MAG: hypothetical protein JNM36_16575 [Chitinophagales bacterium]|jgi:hypothetical protein|nr:hypothetical protein [Chitinophagales bacterium]